MSPEERAKVVAMLPPDDPLDLMAPPEGDTHRKAKVGALDALDAFFRRIGRKVYLSSELSVYYPGEPRFAPDVLAVLDVEPLPRNSWVVSHEGKGLDLVIEVLFLGDRRKDHERNVERYAALGIPEYFIFDRAHLGLRGFRLPSPKARVYKPILPQAGRFPSAVLGLDLAIEQDKLRFYMGTAALPDSEELIGRLESMVTTLLRNKEDAEQERERMEREREEERARMEREREEERARVEEERAEAARTIAELKAEIERLKAER
jgi:Uma2 family endonuclease